MDNEKIKEFQEQLDKMTIEELKDLSLRYLIAKEKTRLRKVKHYANKKKEEK
ncbi:MAG: hypothetical protein J6D47_00880 [Peptostreptococcaceae bacterium]|nr:hypothetical protein [Peptostreptococcaceae bacterium]